jgi:tripartite-type tricarboxylate transporter receptor subunit TctC
MILHRMPRWALLLVWAASVAGGVCTAEAFPTRALTLLVPFPPGGTTDVTARAVAQALSRQLGQAVVVDNKAGAGGTVGATQVLRAAADGYTLLMGGPADQVNAPFLMAKPPYDPAREFEPVGCVMRSSNVLVVHPKLPVQSLADLLRLAKAEPGKLNYGSAGNGNTSHLSGELLALTAGVDLTQASPRCSSTSRAEPCERWR